jgi:hypothetical protein
MAAFTFAALILPGKQEAWRRFMQEILESRNGEHEESRRCLGITRELVWFVQTSLGEMAIVYLETEDQEREQVVVNMAASPLPFDRWFRQQLVELLGVDVTHSSPRSSSELVFEWYSA